MLEKNCRGFPILESKPGADVEHPDGAFGWIQRRVLDELRIGRDREAISNGHSVEGFNCILVTQTGPNVSSFGSPQLSPTPRRPENASVW